MIKLGWALTSIGFIAIICGLLYPFGAITKETFLVLLIGGALVMFIGSMVRAMVILKKKD